MNVERISVDLLLESDEMRRSVRSKQFEERLFSSISAMGLAEPLKVVPVTGGKYQVIDGYLRLEAIRKIRQRDAQKFCLVPAYVFSYELRYELRFQSDIYQDLLPSQLATLVEHLHQAESVRKSDIAGYIGVSPTTVRNYTGVWRLLRRSGYFAKVVELMDVGVLPASNPYAWLRLSDAGVVQVLERSFATTADVDEWISASISGARRGDPLRYTTEYVEVATGSLDSSYYREDRESREIKRDLGLRRSATREQFLPGIDVDRHPKETISRLSLVIDESESPVLRTAAGAMLEFLR